MPKRQTPYSLGPQLIFHAGEVDDLRKRVESTHAFFFRRLKSDLELRLGQTPPADIWNLREPDCSNFLEIGFSTMVNSGIAFHITKDRKYEKLAEHWLREWLNSGIPEKEKFKNIWGYLVTFHIMTLAFALDLFGEYLPEDLRHETEETLWQETATMTDLMQSGEGEWSRRYLYHDCWLPVFGAGIGCLALLRSRPQAKNLLDAVEKEVQCIYALLDDDGAWGEGVAPLNYCLGELLIYRETRRRILDEPLPDLTWLKNLSRWRAAHLLPDGNYIFLDDSTPSGRYHGETGGTPTHHLYKIAAEYRDGLAQWQGDYEARRSFLKDYHSWGWCLLWHDPSVPALPPETFPRAYFSHSQGQFFSRSGFSSDASVLSFECAPPGSDLAQKLRASGLPPQTISMNKHAHYRDRATFSFYVNKEYFFRPSGYFRFETHLKNALTFDGYGQSLDPDSGGGMSGTFADEDAPFTAACANATAAYPDVVGLKHFSRTVVHLRNIDILTVADVVQFSDPDRHTIEAHFLTGREINAEKENQHALRLTAPSGSRSLLIFSGIDTPEYKPVPAPLDPYYRDYLSKYDIHPEDLKAMEQIDRQFVFQVKGKSPHLLLWMILPLIGKRHPKYTPFAGTNCTGILLSGENLELSVILSNWTEVADSTFHFAIPGCSEQLLLIGGYPGSSFQYTFLPVNGNKMEVIIGKGDVCRFNNAGTALLEI